MPTTDPRLDDYIARAPEFARPVLAHLRALVHAGCPDVVETIKWRHPAFEYRGMLANMAAFKAHVAFGFWKGKQVVDAEGKSFEAMGQFGRLTRVADLPGKRVMLGYIRQAARLNEDGATAGRPRKPARGESVVPADLQAALRKDRQAAATFEGFPPGQRREYIDWLAEAKQEATRARRLVQAIAWMAEGKRRNWKYERG